MTTNDFNSLELNKTSETISAENNNKISTEKNHFQNIPKHQGLLLPDTKGRLPLTAYDMLAAAPLILFDGRVVGIYQSDINHRYDAVLSHRSVPPAIHFTNCKRLTSTNKRRVHRYKCTFEGADKLPVTGFAEIDGRRHWAEIALPICKECLKNLSKATGNAPLIKLLHESSSSSFFFEHLEELRILIKHPINPPLPLPDFLSKPSIHQLNLNERKFRPDLGNADEIYSGEDLHYMGGLLQHRERLGFCFSNTIKRDITDYFSGLKKAGTLHFADCSIMKKCHESEDLHSKFLSNDKRGVFAVTGYDPYRRKMVTKHLPFPICKSCLRAINWNNCCISKKVDLPSLDQVSRRYRSVFHDSSALTSEQIQDYFQSRGKGFYIKARKINEEHGWKCARCGVVLDKYHWLLNDIVEDGKIKPLCASCYRSTIGLLPPGIGYRSIRFLNALRHETGCIVEINWNNVRKEADPAVRDLLTMAHAAGYEVPEIDKAISFDVEGREITYCPDLLWKNRKIAVILRLEQAFEIGEWKFETIVSLISKLRNDPNVLQCIDGIFSN